MEPLREVGLPTEQTADERQLSRRLRAAFATPVGLLIATGAVLWLQLQRMAADQSSLEHSDQVLTQVSNYERQVIDQETGLRGFQLTGDRLFLEPYARAHPTDVAQSLRVLVSDNPAQQARVDEMTRRYDAWFAGVRSLASAPFPHDAASLAEAVDRKRQMDGLRAAIDAFVTEESRLRTERELASGTSNGTTHYAFLGLLLASGLAIAFLSRRQLASFDAACSRALMGERQARKVLEEEAWLRDARARVVEGLQGDPTIQDLGQRLLGTLASLVGAEVGALFVLEKDTWQRRASYGLDGRSGGPSSFPVGEGLVGRAAVDEAIVHVRDVPRQYLSLRSGTGETVPVEIVLVPARVGAHHAGSRRAGTPSPPRGPRQDTARARGREHRDRRPVDRGPHAAARSARGGGATGRRASVSAGGAACHQRGAGRAAATC